MIKELNEIKLMKGTGKPQALYQQIERQLRSKITDGNIAFGDRLPSITQIVHSFGVSPATVNAAFDSLERDGLIRREPGKGKGPVVIRKARQKCTIKYIRWSRDFLDLQLSEGIAKYVSEHELELIIVDVSNATDSLVDVIQNAHADGILIFPHYTENFKNAINNIISSNSKIVFVDHGLDNVDIDSVSIDNINGGYIATKHLLRSCRQPVFHMRLPIIESAEERQKGWVEAMYEFGYEDVWPYIYVAEEKIMFNNDPLVKHEWLTNLAKQIFKENKLKSYSFFTTNDHLAKAVYVAAHQLGFKVGENVFIAGFGDYPLCEQLEVPLTSVHQSNELVGYEAAKLLHMKIIGTTEKGIVHRKLPAKLIIRDSSIRKS